MLPPRPQTKFTNADLFLNVSHLPANIQLPAQTENLFDIFVRLEYFNKYEK